jgi:hypothetical protein
MNWFTIFWSSYLLLLWAVVPFFAVSVQARDAASTGAVVDVSVINKKNPRMFVRGFKNEIRILIL